MENTRFADVYRLENAGSLHKIEKTENGLRLHAAEKAILQLEVIAEDVICVSYLPDAFRQMDHSYAIDPAREWSPVTWSWREDDQQVYLMTDALKCIIQKSNLQLAIYNHSGVPLQKDKAGWSQTHSILEGIQQVELSIEMPADTHYYGLGDKPAKLSLRGQRFENWNSDVFGYMADTDPVYRSVPFYYSLTHGKACGLFLDNSYRSHFDFGKTVDDELSIQAAGGVFRYYFIYGPELSNVGARYAQLTGTAALPPMWALGFHQCRWSYHPEARVREIANTFRELEIPCDSIYLDIDYMDDYRCFTWDAKKFPDPKGMIADLKEQGFHTVVMIDPGIKVEPGFFVFDQGMQRDAFCRRPDGSLMIGPVWPGDCVFPDYTDAEVRQWWGDLYEELYNETGVSGFWNDMNEPAVFRVTSLSFPEDVRHHHEGHPTDHKQIHNVYGMQMARASTEGLQRLQPEKRPFLLSRSCFSGAQRYAAVWSGDNTASWEHLAIANRQCQRLSISGFSFCGSDIGGFVEQPTGELMVRWLQLGAFHPFFRVHSIGDHDDGAAEVDQGKLADVAPEYKLNQEPWSFGEPYTALAREAINLRYRLLPYLYTLMWHHHEGGQPVLLPLAFYDQSDELACKREREFMLGPNLLISPVLMPDQKQQAVYLPKGQWYHYHTGQWYQGGQFHRVATPMDYIPTFVKAGRVIPHHGLRQYTDAPVPELILEVYYAEGRYQSQLYEDAGEGYAYQQGAYRHSQFSLTGKDNKLHLQWTHEGDYQPDYTQVKVVVYGLGQAKTATVDGQEVLLSKQENGTQSIVWEAALFGVLEVR